MNATKKLFTIYLSLVVIQVILSSLIVSPTIFGDEYTYAKGARNLFQQGAFSVHDTPITAHPPLYALAIAPAYFFDDMQLVYLMIKIINAILSAAIIFPAYFLGKEFFSKRKALYGSVLIGIMPAVFASTPYILSENLFHTLFLLSIYCIFKSITEKHWKWYLLAGISIGLAYLTRFIGLVLLAALGILFLYYLVKRNKEQVKGIIITGAIGILLPLFWLVRNSALGNKNVITLITHTVTTGSSDITTIGTIGLIIAWIFIHLTYLILATGIIPSIFYLVKEKTNGLKTKRFFALTSILIVLLVGLLAKRILRLGVKEITPIAGFVGRIIGRYVDPLVPLILLGGFLGLRSLKAKQKLKKATLICVAIVTGGFFIWYYPLFPYNNSSVTLFGLAKVAVEYLLTGSIQKAYISPITLILAMATLYGILFLTYKMSKQITLQKMFWLITLFFLISSTGSYAATYYNAQIWDENEHLAVGKYLNEEGKKDFSIIIDESFCGERLERDNTNYLCTANKRLSYVGFWINKDITITKDFKDKENTYIITKDDLKGKAIKETKNGIKVYKQ